MKSWALLLISFMFWANMAGAFEIVDNPEHAGTSFLPAFAMQERYRQDVSRLEVTPAYLEVIKKSLDRIAASLSSGGNEQFIVLADRNPSTQLGGVIFLNLAEQKAVIVGWDLISTGNQKRRGHFLTPVGIFLNSPEHFGYRSLGTPNEKGWRGLGAKDSRVWDFGWVSTQISRDRAESPLKIRLLMHATDPNFGEPRLGKVNSKGCVRISARMNRFLDHYGIIDVLYLESGLTKTKALLKRDREAVAASGRFLAVIDSGSIEKTEAIADQKTANAK